MAGPIGIGKESLYILHVIGKRKIEQGTPLPVFEIALNKIERLAQSEEIPIARLVPFLPIDTEGLTVSRIVTNHAPCLNPHS